MLVTLLSGQISLCRVMRNRIHTTLSDVLIKLLPVKALFHFPFLNIFESFLGSAEVIGVMYILVFVIISLLVFYHLLPKFVRPVLDDIGNHGLELLYFNNDFYFILE